MLGALSWSVIAALSSTQMDRLRSFDDYPQTTIEYYAVSGTSASELRAEMRRLGPSNGGSSHANARTFYTFSWVGTSNGQVSCKAEVTLATRIVFPRHANPAALSPPLREEWTRFIKQLEHHELGHIELAIAALPAFEAAIESGPCSGAQQRMQRIDVELNRKQEAFDANPVNRVLHLLDV